LFSPSLFDSANRGLLVEAPATGGGGPHRLDRNEVEECASTCDHQPTTAPKGRKKDALGAAVWRERGHPDGNVTMADALDMALRSYQSIEAGESEYRFIYRLAAERVALMIAADRKAPMLAPQPVRDDAIELVRVGRLTGDPAFQKARAKDDADTAETAGDQDAGFRAAYGAVGELVLLATALDHQLNHVLIQVLHLADSPMLEGVVATLDAVRKIEMLKERSKFIAQARWQKPVLSPFAFSRVRSAYRGSYEWRRGGGWRKLAGENVGGEASSFDELKSALSDPEWLADPDKKATEIALECLREMRKAPDKF
jgi:hypothetical protein